MAYRRGVDDTISIPASAASAGPETTATAVPAGIGVTAAIVVVLPDVPVVETAYGVAAADGAAVGLATEAAACTPELDELLVADEPELEREAPEIEVVVEPSALAAETVVADALPEAPKPLASDRAWLVEPDVLLYLTVNAPEGDVAPCRTAVLLPSSV